MIGKWPFRISVNWDNNEPSVDIGPLPLGDSVVDFEDIAVLADTWLVNLNP